MNTITSDRFLSPRRLIILFLLFVLTACAANAPQPTSTPSPTATPTHSPTPTQTQTPTPTETPTPKPPERDETMDKPLSIVYSFEIQEVKTLEGAVVSGAFAIDDTARQASGVYEITMPEKLGAEIFLKVAAWIHWFHGPNPPSHSGDPAKEDILSFAKKLAEVQSGTRPAEDLASEIYAFDANKPGDQMEPFKICMFPGSADVPGDCQRIERVEFVYGKFSGDFNMETGKTDKNPKYPRFTPVTPTGEGFEAEIDREKGILRIKAGIDYIDSSPIVIRFAIPTLTQISFKWLEVSPKRLWISSSTESYFQKAKRELVAKGFVVKAK